MSQYQRCRNRKHLQSVWQWKTCNFWIFLISTNKSV